ncbi:MAG: amphi-Trp domain-containing protein [Candidatus Nanohaloarchaea archaeon]
MSTEELDLEFEFSNEEMANFFENFAEKVREGEVGLSFKGREEVRIAPNTENNLEMDFEDEDGYRKLEIEATLVEEKDIDEETGRKKIEVEIV